MKYSGIVFAGLSFTLALPHKPVTLTEQGYIHFTDHPPGPETVRYGRPDWVQDFLTKEERGEQIMILPVPGEHVDSVETFKAGLPLATSPPAIFTNSKVSNREEIAQKDPRDRDRAPKPTDQFEWPTLVASITIPPTYAPLFDMDKLAEERWAREHYHYAPDLGSRAKVADNKDYRRDLEQSRGPGMKVQPPFGGVAWERFNDTQLSNMKTKLAALGECPGESANFTGKPAFLSCHAQKQMLKKYVADEEYLRTMEHSPLRNPPAPGTPTVKLPRDGSLFSGDFLGQLGNMHPAKSDGPPQDVPHPKQMWKTSLNERSEPTAASGEGFQRLITPILLNDTQLAALNPSLDRVVHCSQVMSHPGDHTDSQIASCKAAWEAMKVGFDEAAMTNVQAGSSLYWPANEQEATPAAASKWPSSLLHSHARRAVPAHGSLAEKEYEKVIHSSWYLSKGALNDEQQRAIRHAMAMMDCVIGDGVPEEALDLEMAGELGAYNECKVKRSMLEQRLKQSYKLPQAPLPGLGPEPRDFVTWAKKPNTVLDDKPLEPTYPETAAYIQKMKDRLNVLGNCRPQADGTGVDKLPPGVYDRCMNEKELIANSLSEHSRMFGIKDYLPEHGGSPKQLTLSTDSPAPTGDALRLKVLQDERRRLGSTCTHRDFGKDGLGGYDRGREKADVYDCNYRLQKIAEEMERLERKPRPTSTPQTTTSTTSRVFKPSAIVVTDTDMPRMQIGTAKPPPTGSKTETVFSLTTSTERVATPPPTPLLLVETVSAKLFVQNSYSTM